MRRSWPSSIAYRTMLKKSSRVPENSPETSPSVGLWIACVAVALGGCAQQPVQQRVARANSSEYFSSSVYGPASPRVVADGQAVPRGGGQYLVGRPYTVAGRRYFPSEAARETQVGMASYYGSAFHGRKTANGEVFDMAAISAAHPTMPLPSYARVTNTANGRSIIVRVNDRGPYHGGRIMDVSQRVADALDFRRMGTARVRVDYVGKASLGGSDDNKLMASLRTDGQPAALDGMPNASPVMVAGNAPVAPLAPPRQPVVPQRVALAAPPRDEIEEPVVVAAARTTVLPANAPMPPSRPFDLGTIPGAAIPISAGLPPRRTAAVFYADPERSTAHFARRGPFLTDGKIQTRDD
jgi:rare lipoprotein A